MVINNKAKDNSSKDTDQYIEYLDGEIIKFSEDIPKKFIESYDPVTLSELNDNDKIIQKFLFP